MTWGKVGIFQHWSITRDFVEDKREWKSTGFPLNALLTLALSLEPEEETHSGRPISEGCTENGSSDERQQQETMSLMKQFSSICSYKAHFKTLLLPISINKMHSLFVMTGFNTLYSYKMPFSIQLWVKDIEVSNWNKLKGVSEQLYPPLLSQSHYIVYGCIMQGNLYSSTSQ